MCKANSFLLGVLPDIKIMVAERRGFADWSNEASTPKGVPLRSTIEGGTRVYTLKEESFNARLIRSATTDWQCGQHVKDNSHYICRQAQKVTTVLK